MVRREKHVPDTIREEKQLDRPEFLKAILAAG